MSAPSTAPTSGTPGSASTSAPPPTSRRRRRWWIALGVGVVALIIFAGLVGSIPAGSTSSAPPTPTDPGAPQVDVTKVDWAFAGAGNCWDVTSGPGVTVPGGTSFTVSVPLTYNATVSGPKSCTVDSATVETTGFRLVSSDTPLVVTNGSKATLTVEVAAPNAAVRSPLDVQTQVTAGAPVHTVTIPSVTWEFTGPSNCWTSKSGSGTTVPGGSQFTVSVSLAYAGGSGEPYQCTVTSEVVGSSGFDLQGADTPLSVDAGSSETLTATLLAPNVTETTNLTLNGTVSSPGYVTVTGVNWEFSGPSNCWSQATTSGLSVASGAQFTVTVKLSYTAGLLDPDSCTVKSVAVATNGFTVDTANTPLVVDSGSTQTLSVTLTAPNTNETVVLTLDGTVTSP
jgi:hypothetical protein